MHVHVHVASASQIHSTYRIPPKAIPGPSPNGQRLGVGPADGLPIANGEEGVDYRSGIGIVKGKNAGFAGQERIGESVHGFDEGGGDLLRHELSGIGSGGGGSGELSREAQIASKFGAASAEAAAAAAAPHEHRAEGHQQNGGSHPAPLGAVGSGSSGGGGGGVDALRLTKAPVLGASAAAAALLGKEPRRRHCCRILLFTFVSVIYAGRICKLGKVKEANGPQNSNGGQWPIVSDLGSFETGHCPIGLFVFLREVIA